MNATLGNIKQQLLELETARNNEISRFEKQIKDVKNSSISIEAQTQINLYDDEIERIEKTLDQIMIRLIQN